MQEIKVENVIISKQPENSNNLKEFLEIVEEKNINVIVANMGDKILIEENLYFYVLWPDSSNFISENSLNNNSMVCKLVYKDFSMLFTGDIEEIAEKELVSKYAGTDVLKSTVLKVAHHGSKSSSYIDFLQCVLSDIAVIGVGENNLYGHPSEEVIERLNSLRSECL